MVFRNLYGKIWNRGMDLTLTRPPATSSVKIPSTNTSSTLISAVHDTGNVVPLFWETCLVDFSDTDGLPVLRLDVQGEDSPLPNWRIASFSHGKETVTFSRRRNANMKLLRIQVWMSQRSCEAGQLMSCEVTESCSTLGCQW